MLLFMFKNTHISLHFIGYPWIYKQENGIVVALGEGAT